MLSTAAGKILVGLVAAIVLCVGSFFFGKHYGGNAVQVKCQAAQIAQQQTVIKHDDKVAAAAAVQASDAQAVGLQVQTQTEQVHEKVHQVIVKVPVYVPASADAQCSINAGFVRVWNAANDLDGGSLPAPAAGGQQSAGAAAGAGDVQPASAAAGSAGNGQDAGSAQ